MSWQAPALPGFHWLDDAKQRVVSIGVGHAVESADRAELAQNSPKEYTMSALPEIPTEMMAAVMPRPNDLRIQRIPVPAVGDDEVLLRVAACGVCTTDIHLYRGEWKEATFPLIAGHEFAGEVVAVGESVKDVPLGALAVAEGSSVIGFHRPGGYAEYLAVPVSGIVVVPSNVDAIEAALVDPLACGVHMVSRAAASASDKVVVIGQGSSGLCILQAMRALVGCELAAVDNHDENLALSSRFGAALTANPKKCDAVATIRELTRGKGADCVIEVTGRESAVDLAVQMARFDGRVVIYGIFGKRIGIDVDRVMGNQLNLVGAVGNTGCYPKAVELLAQKKAEVRPIVSRIMPLSALAQAWDLLERRLASKIVIVPDSRIGDVK
jgi:2-desacetyl-2-hydroxyethyl bacteriochlorophyllide A dehydrogenase